MKYESWLLSHQIKNWLIPRVGKANYKRLIKGLVEILAHTPTAEFSISASEAFRRGEDDYAIGFKQDGELLFFWDYGDTCWQFIPYPYLEYRTENG